MRSHEKTLAASARTSSLANREKDSNKYSEQKTVLGLASADLWCKHFCSSQAKACLLRSALSLVLGVPSRDSKTHPGHLPKSSRLSGRQGPLLGSPSLPQEGSGRAAQQPSASKCALQSGPLNWATQLQKPVERQLRLGWLGAIRWQASGRVHQF